MISRIASIPGRTDEEYTEISLLHDEPCLFRLSFTLYAAVSMSRGGDTHSPLV